MLRFLHTISHIGGVPALSLLLRWQERPFVKAPVADLLLPEDIVRGCIHETHPDGSVMERLLQAVQLWEAEAGEQQV